jgi:hypothetical protein
VQVLPPAGELTLPATGYVVTTISGCGCCRGQKKYGFLGGGTGLCRLLADSTSEDMDDILSVERPFDRRTPCIGLGVGGGGPRGL